MKILYVGDVEGRPGRKVIKHLLPKLRVNRSIDFVIAQAENLSGGRGIKLDHMRDMQQAGIDFFTGGNHTWRQPDIFKVLDDPSEPIVRPLNYVKFPHGSGYRIAETPKGKVLVVSLHGQIVGKEANEPMENPLLAIDKVLEETASESLVATIVNFHGDYSSEKRVIGYYLDGRVSAVIGDHWHVPTADAMVLPKGTAHITDVGMVGVLHSSLGVKTDVIINRWRSRVPSKNVLETKGPYQFCAVEVEIDPKTGLATHIEQLIEYVEL